MNKEIFMLKARLADKKKTLKNLTRRADNFIITIRDIIDPYTEDFTELELDRAKVAMQDFYALWKEARKLKTDIERMEKDLNG